MSENPPEMRRIHVCSGQFYGPISAAVFYCRESGEIDALLDVGFASVQQRSMTRKTFTGSFTQQEPLPPEAISAAVAVMESGRLHRYNTVPGETSEAALLEAEFASQTGAAYCLAVTSGGAALALALRALGVGAGDRVLTNAFTLAPVPGAIAGVGAQPVFVGTDRDLKIDLADLEAKLATGPAALMLSHMRGHICDMDALMALCDRAGVPVIEDCAHTMGASWDGQLTGRFGRVGCFSTQTYKHANSGEGGLVISDDPDLMARATHMSGSYMLWDRHGAGPEAETFERATADTPNLSCRMDNLRAAILRPQLPGLNDRVTRWRKLYDAFTGAIHGVRLPQRPDKEGFAPSSVQFFLDGWNGDAIATMVQACAARGVELKWFGAPKPAGFTSRYSHWEYAPAQSLPDTDAILHGLLDMRLPLTFCEDDCRLIAEIITEEVAAHGP